MTFDNTLNIYFLVDSLESALNLLPEQFEKEYHHRKPQTNEPIIFACKRGIRVLRARVIALNHGYQK